MFDELRATRADFARADNVPPYVVFSDATLIEMATYLPLNEADMLEMSGVGDAKFEKYGADFLHIVRSYCTQNKVETRIGLKAKSSRSPKKSSSTRRNFDGKDTYETTLNMFAQGQAIAEIAMNRGLSPNTIEAHLIRYIPSGEVQLHDIVAADKVDRIQAAIIQCGESAALAPIKELLGETYSYGEINAVMAQMGKAK